LGLVRRAAIDTRARKQQRERNLSAFSPVTNALAADALS
jgi:hypothetical protein